MFSGMFSYTIGVPRGHAGAPPPEWRNQMLCHVLRPSPVARRREGPTAAPSLITRCVASQCSRAQGFHGVRRAEARGRTRMVVARARGFLRNMEELREQPAGAERPTRSMQLNPTAASGARAVSTCVLVHPLVRDLPHTLLDRERGGFGDAACSDHAGVHTAAGDRHLPAPVSAGGERESGRVRRDAAGADPRHVRYHVQHGWRGAGCAAGGRQRAAHGVQP
jgi:hypothetical protein